MKKKLTMEEIIQRFFRLSSEVTLPSIFFRTTSLFVSLENYIKIHVFWKNRKLHYHLSFYHYYEYKQNNPNVFYLRKNISINRIKHKHYLISYYLLYNITLILL